MKSEINSVHNLTIFNPFYTDSYEIYYLYGSTSPIRTHVWEPIMIIHVYRESDSFIRIFSYLDSQLGNVGVWISKGSLYTDSYEVYYLYGSLPLQSNNLCMASSPLKTQMKELHKRPVGLEQYTLLKNYILKLKYLTLI